MKRVEKHKPPSRIRYEESHPVLSIRMPKETYERIKEIRQKSGKSLANILKEGLGIQETTVGDAYKIGFEEGVDKGIEQRSWVSVGTCEICGKPLLWDIREKRFLKVLADAIQRHGYRHEKCKRDEPLFP